MRHLNSLSDVAEFARHESEVLPLQLGHQFQGFELDPAFLRQLPPPVARAVEGVARQAALVNSLLKDALSGNKAPAFAAFAADTLHLEADAAELESWTKLGLDTQPFRDLLRRADNLELQDDEVANAILTASDKTNLSVLMGAFILMAQAVDNAIAILQAAKDDPAMQREFQVETDTPLGKIIVRRRRAQRVHERSVSDHRHGRRRHVPELRGWRERIGSVGRFPS